MKTLAYISLQVHVNPDGERFKKKDDCECKHNY